MSDNKIEVKVDAYNLDQNANYTLIVREGQAAPAIQHPTKLGYAGRLDTPRLFLDPKKANYDPLQCTFEVDSEKNAVRFIGTEKSYESVDTISGRLVASAAIEQFKLNTGERWTVAQLIELVKRMRPFFATKETQLVLLARLRNWSIDVNKLFEEVSNLDGNSKRAVTVKVEGQIPPPFVLKLPIYKGYSAEAVEVEFGVDAEGMQAKLYLDSPELLDLLEKRKVEYIKQETDYFAAFGCSVIYVS